MADELVNADFELIIEVPSENIWLNTYSTYTLKIVTPLCDLCSSYDPQFQRNQELSNSILKKFDWSVDSLQLNK